MAIIQRSSAKIFFPGLAFMPQAAQAAQTPKPTPVQQASIDDENALENADSSKPSPIRAPSVYGVMLDGKETEGTVPKGIDLYSNSFDTKPDDENLQVGRDAYSAEWSRTKDGTVTIHGAYEFDSDKPEPEAHYRTQSFDVTETVYRNEEGLHVTTIQKETDNGVTPLPQPAAENPKVNEPPQKPELGPDVYLNVQSEQQYDKKGFLAERTITRDSTGGGNNLNANATLHETYAAGYLAKSVFDSTTTETKEDMETSHTVHKDQKFDKGVLLESHKVINEHSLYKGPNDPNNPNGYEDNIRRTQDITRDSDGTYIIGETRQTQLYGKIFSETRSSITAKDPEGRDIISGIKTEIDEAGNKTETHYDPRTKKWVPTENKPHAENIEQPIGGSVTTTVKAAAAQQKRPSSGAPAI